jgi:hypothetical protein
MHREPVKSKHRGTVLFASFIHKVALSKPFVIVLPHLVGWRGSKIYSAPVESKHDGMVLYV